MPFVYPDPRPPSFPWRELDADQKSPLSAVYDQSGANTVVRLFKVSDLDLYGSPSRFLTLKQAVREVLGWAEYAPNPAGQLTRHLPVTDPDDPSMVALRCEVRGVNAWGDKSDLVFPTPLPVEAGPEFEEYLFTVTFQHVEYEVDPDDFVGSDPLKEAGRFCIVEALPAPDLLTLDQKFFVWNADASNPDSAGNYTNLGRANAVPVFNSEIRVTWLQVPEDAITTNLELFINTVNSITLNLPHPDGLYRAYPPGTVLFASPRVGKRKQFADGSPYRDIQLTFRYKSAGWNNAVASDGKFYKVVFASDHTRSPFDTNDLNLIFQGPP